MTLPLVTHHCIGFHLDKSSASVKNTKQQMFI